MLAAPMIGNLALLWIAIEVTTMISALLVAIEDTTAAGGRLEVRPDRLGRARPGPAGDVFCYSAGAQVLGQHYDLAFDQLLRRRPGCRTPRSGWRSCWPFWASAPRWACCRCTPGCRTRIRGADPGVGAAVRSLLAVSFYAILRYCQVAERALGPRFPRDVLLVFGIASLLLAALYLLDQRDVKRLLAYSSVEHMGILAIGVSFGAPIALAGVLLHVLAHAAAKGNAFMGAGVLVRKFGSKRIAAISGGLDLLPWSGPLFLLAILALWGDAAVRHLPQRVRDRRAAGFSASANARRRDADRAGHCRVPRAVAGRQPDAADCRGTERGRPR